MRKMFTLLCLAVLTTTLQAQKAQMLFYGVVEEGVLTDPSGDEKPQPKKQKPLRSVKVSVYCAGELISSNESKESGFFGVLLRSGANYEVVFEKEGYFSRRFAMNCKNLQHPSDGSALKCPLDIDLFKEVDNAELKRMAEKPYGVCSVNRNDIHWDKEAIVRNKMEFYKLAEPLYQQNTK